MLSLAMVFLAEDNTTWKDEGEKRIQRTIEEGPPLMVVG
jgi:hypothetical protein